MIISSYHEFKINLVNKSLQKVPTNVALLILWFQSVKINERNRENKFKFSCHSQRLITSLKVTKSNRGKLKCYRSSEAAHPILSYKKK